MTQWEAFIKMYDAGCKEYFNPMFGIIIVKNVCKEEKTVSFAVRVNPIISFTVNSDFKVANKPHIKQCVFPTSDCDDFVVYINTFRKHLLLKPNAPVCISRPHPTYAFVFGVITKICESYAEVILQKNCHPIPIAIDDILTIEEAKNLLKSKDNVQTIQN